MVCLKVCQVSNREVKAPVKPYSKNRPVNLFTSGAKRKEMTGVLLALPGFNGTTDPCHAYTTQHTHRYSFVILLFLVSFKGKERE